MNKYKRYNSCIILVTAYVIDIYRHSFVHCIIYIIIIIKSNTYPKLCRDTWNRGAEKAIPFINSIYKYIFLLNCAIDDC